MESGWDDPSALSGPALAAAGGGWRVARRERIPAAPKAAAGAARLAAASQQWNLNARTPGACYSLVFYE